MGRFLPIQAFSEADFDLFPIQGFIGLQTSNKPFDLIAMRGDDLCCPLLSVGDQAPDSLVDLMRRVLAEPTGLGDLASEEGRLSARNPN